MPGEEAGGGDPCRHVGELPLNCLVSAKRLAELLSFPGIPDTGLKRALRKSDCQRSNPDPPSIQHLHRLCESFPLCTDQVFVRDADVFEHEHGSIA